MCPISRIRLWAPVFNEFVKETKECQSTELILVYASVHGRLNYYNSVLTRLPGSLVQQLQSVLNSAACLIFKRFDLITLAVMDLHWLPYPQRNFV